MKIINLKQFFGLSILVHFIFILSFLIFGNNQKDESIVINISNNITEEEQELIEINDISSEDIFNEMKSIELEKKSMESEKLLQIDNKKQIANQLKEIESLKRKKSLISKNIASNEENLKNQERKIKKLDKTEKKLKDDNKKLDKINSNLDKKIQLKKKESKIKKESKTKSKKIYKKNTDYKNSFSKYISEIGYTFRKNWVIPLNAEENWLCTVKVTQNKKGELKDFDIMNNCPADPDFLRSIDKAIKLSTPLPSPPKTLDFDDIKEITLEFKLKF